MRKKLTRKIKLYIKRYNTDSYKSNKIIDALNLIESNSITAIYPKIRKYRIFLIKGKRGTYLTIKNTYCSCIGFTASLMKGRIKPCYHLIALEMIKEEQVKKTFFEPEKLYDLALKHGVENLLRS